MLHKMNYSIIIYLNTATACSDAIKLQNLTRKVLFRAGCVTRTLQRLSAYDGQLQVRARRQPGWWSISASWGLMIGSHRSPKLLCNSSQWGHTGTLNVCGNLYINSPEGAISHFIHWRITRRMEGTYPDKNILPRGTREP